MIHWMEVGVVCTCLQVTIVLYGDHDSSIVLPVSWQDSAVLDREREGSCGCEGSAHITQ